MKKIFTIVGLVAVSVSLVPIAHAQTNSTLVMPVESSSSPEVLVIAPTTSIARLQLGTGAMIQFVDLRDGHVGVAERAPRNQPFVSTAMVREWNATPLEIFMALAPSSYDIPRALTADHNARFGSDVSRPRLLSPPRTTLNLDDPGVEDFDCNAEGTNFYFGWLDTFENVTDHVSAGVGHNLFDKYTFYPGGHYNDDGSISPGYNQVTYLGACNGDDDTPLTVEVHRRMKYLSPPNVMYIWTEITEVLLSDNEKYTFYSDLPASYRIRLKPPMDDLVDHFGVGVAYTKAPPLGIEF
jgi:hypothetical protein